METVSQYIEKIKVWSKAHPIKSAFVFGFIAGFIVKGVLF